MDKLIWKALMWIWIRRAKRSYGGPGERGEWFNTSRFQDAVNETTGVTPDKGTANSWLAGYGLRDKPD